MNRALVALVVGGAACGGTRAAESTYHAPATTGDEGGGGPRVGGGRFARADVEHAIKAEEDALAALDAKIDAADAADDGKDPDAPVRRAAMHADRVAGAAFAAQLQACLATADACPPSLDEPTIASDFDLATHQFKGAFNSAAAAWPDAAAAIEKAACGCRTGTCVDWVLADLDRWEAALPAATQADEAAATHVVGARACLWSRLGKKSPPVVPAAEAP